MWPWDHAAFGYVLYSLAVRLGGRRPGEEIVALAVGTQFPDLVDKSLAWVFHLTAAGYSVGHSVFLAVPLGLLVVATAVRLDRTAVGAAAAIGYWSHLLGDVVWALAVGSPVVFERVLWPVAPVPPYGTTPDAVERVAGSLELFSTLLLSGTATAFLAAYLALWVLVVGLWVADGGPGTGTVGRLLAVVRRARDRP